MTPITSDAFLAAWKTVASSRAAEIENLWDALREYTSMIFHGDRALIADVAAELHLLCYPHTYYHTDAILYTDEDIVPRTEEKGHWFRSFKVAFEHEHKWNDDLYQEISHLLVLRSQLSVIVTYPPDRDTDRLNYFHQIISTSPCANELHANRNFLLILGYRKPQHWEGLVYQRDNWEPLSP